MPCSGLRRASQTRGVDLARRHNDERAGDVGSRAPTVTFGESMTTGPSAGEHRIVGMKVSVHEHFGGTWLESHGLVSPRPRGAGSASPLSVRGASWPVDRLQLIRKWCTGHVNYRRIGERISTSSVGVQTRS